ncbi:MAG: molecular chaperone [Rhodanobacter sp.]
MPARILVRGWLAAGLMAVCGMLDAAGLQVAPVGLAFKSSSPAQGLWLTNSGSDALHAQVRVFHWTQAEGKDVLTPTQALVASPPMLTLQPGARQLVRVIRTGAASAGATEDAFRLLVDELPQPEQAAQTGVRYIMRYSVPVFIEPAHAPDASAVAASLHWSLLREDNGVALQVHNAGATHAQISAASLLPSGGKPVEVTAGLLGYVLPGMTMHWTLNTPAAQLPAGSQLKATINGKPVDQAVPVGDLPR